MSDSIHELLSLIIEQQQTLRHQQIINGEVLREFVEEASGKFDEIDTRLTALENDQDTGTADPDKLIRQERIRHLKQLTLSMRRHLHRLQEKAAEYGLDTPIYIDVQIEEYQEKLEAVAEELKQINP